jgi:hypothetical protein
VEKGLRMRKGGGNNKSRRLLFLGQFKRQFQYASKVMLGSPILLNWARFINGEEKLKKTKQQHCSVVANKDDNWAGKYVFGSAQLDNSAKTD